MTHDERREDDMYTTAMSVPRRDFATNRVQQALLALCVGFWLWAAWDPVYREDWLLENILVVAGVGVFLVIHRARPFSDLSCTLMAVFFCLHVAGSHYTYSEVPWGMWIKETFHHSRNHYDRIVHFSFGLLLSYPVREIYVRALRLRGFQTFFFTFVTMVACSEVYELMEWGVAAVVAPEAGSAFLGTQGDEFDAQKDTALALLGTLAALTVTWVKEKSGRDIM